jgi:hypothetical protein
MPPSTLQHAPLGYRAFDRLEAEHERDWLMQVFVPPADFEAMASMRSIVVFGAGGAGKTALRIALTRRALGADAGSNPLVVEWRPSLPTDPALSGSQALRGFLADSLSACALALLRHLGRRSETFGAAPEWVQETAVWFMHRYLARDHAVLLGKLAEECGPVGIALLRDLLSREPRPVLEPDAPESRVIVELAGLTERLGLAGVWLLVDGLEPWVAVDAEPLTRLLDALFSTLALFEDPGFAMKIVVPNTIEPRLTSNRGIGRRRLDVYRLEYPIELLIAIAERRIAAAAGRMAFHLGELCAEAKDAKARGSKELIDWLSRCGGHTPRAWLNLIRPLADEYIARSEPRPLTIKECAEIFRRHPPIIRLNLETERVFIGEGELTSLSPTSYKLLRYLYQQRRRCTRSELYYLVCRGLTMEPRASEDPGWEDPSSWNETFDTILWRLRKQIELDLKTPIYIITDRGKGVRLENAW